MTPVLIFGAGGLGHEVSELLHDLRANGGPYAPFGFAADLPDDAPPPVRVLPFHRDAAAVLREHPALRVVVAIGNPRHRADVAARLEAAVGQRFATLVHPRACLGGSVTLGEGTIVMQLASATSNVLVGRHVVINPGVTIAHDADIASFATIGPSVALAGGVRIGQGAQVGIGARVLPRLDLRSWCVVGAGAVVTRDVPSGATVLGIPARMRA